MRSNAMTKADLLSAAKGKPVPFEGPDGFSCLLRPLTWGERKGLFEWLGAHRDDPGSGLELDQKLILAAVCDEAGVNVLDPEDLTGFALHVSEAIAKEVAKRNGMDGKAGEPGKG